MKMTFKYALLLAATSISLVACEKKVSDPAPTTGGSGTTESVADMHFKFENYFGNEPLVLNTGNYTTSQNEEITVTTFNYWITNIKFMNSNGNEYAEPESYRALKAKKGSSLHFHVSDVPAGTYTGVKFMIGVDVPRNTSGAQTGELDPAVNGDMYWNWNTGYIQAKLEGIYKDANNDAQVYKHHIGGIKAGEETPREVSFTFATPITVSQSTAGSFVFKTDLAKWFGPATPVIIANMPTMMHTGAMASKIADNYKEMFSLTAAGTE